MDTNGSPPPKTRSPTCSTPACSLSHATRLQRQDGRLRLHPRGANQESALSKPDHRGLWQIQYKAKGYPGIRELQVLRGIGEQGIVASICPADVSDGYRPAIEAVLDRIRVPLRGRCLPRQIAVREDGSIPCAVLEVFTPEEGSQCTCNDPRFPGRSPLADDLRFDQRVASLGGCPCQMNELRGEDKLACLKNTSTGSSINGWCYVDPQQSGDAAQCPLVKKCPATGRRIIRYMGVQPRGKTVIMCQEQAFAEGQEEGTDVCEGAQTDGANRAKGTRSMPAQRSTSPVYGPGFMTPKLVTGVCLSRPTR